MDARWFRRLWTMLADYQRQLHNAAALARGRNHAAVE